ncbi:MAG: exonuclease SbcCD subunit D, partial [Corynebacterium matruchotii]
MTALTTRFLHTSDLQLGMTRWFLQETEDAQALFDAARVEAITRLGEKAIEYQCDFIIVAGDVFEHNSISTKTRERALAALAALPVDVYLLPGNHDPLTADSIFYRAESHPRIHVFTDNTPIEVAPGVELIGAPWHSKTPSCDLVSHAIAGLEPA